MFNSTHVTRSGVVTSAAALESALNQSWNKPRPSYLGHDIHRPIGWSKSLALYLQPGLARLFGSISVVENTADGNEAEKLARRFQEGRIAEADPVKTAELGERLANHLSSNASILVPSCIAYVDNDLAKKMFPEIFSSADKDGLVPLSMLNSIAPGVFEQDGLIFFAHQFFRRSLSRFNTLNEPFLQRFQSLAAKEGLDLRIALDDSLVGLAKTLRSSIELQYWWGPHFTDDLSRVQLGVTRHENNEFEQNFHGISRTEFWWYQQKDQRVFECEEVLNDPSLGVSPNKYGCRFVHSLLDAKTSRPQHLDAAVRMYAATQMDSRRKSDIMRFGRRSEYTKLWRVDGDLDVRTWKELISDSFRDNRLVGEYFGGVEPGDQTTLREALTPGMKTTPLSDFVPSTMSSGDGVRISISYRNIDSSISDRRFILPTMICGEGNDAKECIEACATDLLKLLRRSGDTINWPTGLPSIAFEDRIFGFPLIVHCGSESVQDAQRTLDRYGDLCDALVSIGKDRTMVFHIGIRFADRDAIFSMAGHASDLQRWLSFGSAKLPSNREAIGDWAETAILVLDQLFPDAQDVPLIENILKTTGLLTLDRVFLSRDEYTIQKDPSSGDWDVQLTEHPNIGKALPLIQNEKLIFAEAWVLKDSICNSCGESYSSYPCIKFLEGKVLERVVDGEFLGLFWTNRN